MTGIVGITCRAETLFPYVLVCRGGLRLLEPQCLLLFVPCGIVLIYNNTADFLGFLRFQMCKRLESPDAAQC